MHSTVNHVWIDTPAAEIWPYLTTIKGWNRFLSDSTYIANGKEEVELGDRLRLVIGELMIRSQCVEYRKHRCIAFDERYAAILPNGRTWEYALTTTFTLEPFEEAVTKVTVTVDGYGKNEMMQWIRECGEMGWRQSLLHLKNVIELGLDLRETIFNYPRLGVLNYTATAKQIAMHGPAGTSIRGNYIKTVYTNGPAHRAGIPEDAVVTAIGGSPVPDYRQFVEALGQYYGKPGEVIVVYYRHGERRQATVALTYEDQFTGMIDPNRVSREELQRERAERSK